MFVELLSRLRIIERLEEVRVKPEEFLGALHHPGAGVDVALQEGVARPDLPLGVHNRGPDGVEDSEEVDDTHDLVEGETPRVLRMSVARDLGVLEDKYTQTTGIVGTETHFG